MIILSRRVIRLVTSGFMCWGQCPRRVGRSGPLIAADFFSGVSGDSHERLWPAAARTSGGKRMRAATVGIDNGRRSLGPCFWINTRRVGSSRYGPSRSSVAGSSSSRSTPTSAIVMLSMPGAPPLRSTQHLRPPQDVSAEDLVSQRMKPQQPCASKKHRPFPSPTVLLSARLNQYYDRLRLPPG